MLAYEASDCGLLSPDLAAGIRRVKGAKRLGVRIGNWLSAEQGRTLLSTSAGSQLREARDRAVLAVLIGCGLRRAEAVTVKIEDLQLRSIPQNSLSPPLRSVHPLRLRTWQESD